jgi:hypothetical protein
VARYEVFLHASNCEQGVASIRVRSGGIQVSRI